MVDPNHSLWLSTSHLTALWLHMILTTTSIKTEKSSSSQERVISLCPNLIFRTTPFYFVTYCPFSVESPLCPNTAHHKYSKHLRPSEYYVPIHFDLRMYTATLHTSATAMALFCTRLVVRLVCQRDREVNFPSQPIAMVHTKRPQRVDLTAIFIFADHLRPKLMTVSLTHQRSYCAKACLYKKMTPQLLPPFSGFCKATCASCKTCT